MSQDSPQRRPRYIAPTYVSRRRPRGWRDWQVSATQIIVLVVGIVFAGVAGPWVF